MLDRHIISYIQKYLFQRSCLMVSLGQVSLAETQHWIWTFSPNPIWYVISLVQQHNLRLFSIVTIVLSFKLSYLNQGPSWAKINCLARICQPCICASLELFIRLCAYLTKFLVSFRQCTWDYPLLAQGDPVYIISVGFFHQKKAQIMMFFRSLWTGVPSVVSGGTRAPTKTFPYILRMLLESGQGPICRFL